MYLVESFFSIQGEGRYLGVPSLFFRFGGCNMRCEGFGCEETAEDGTTLVGCDTIYAVDKKHFSHKWIQLKHSNELIAIFEQYDLPANVDVVFTGGEPLLYADDRILIEFLEYLHVKSIRFTFETNATILPDFTLFPIFKEAVYALSVKLANSLEPYSKRIKADTIFSIASSAEVFFKFSIDAESINLGLDDEISEILSHAPTTQVYCMPVGSSRAEVEKNALPLIEYCKSKGYTYSDRLHIRIWDQTHGV